MRPALPVLGLVLAFALPGAGFHQPGLPVLDEVPVAQDGYAAWRLFVPAGETVSFDVEAPAPTADTVATGVWLMRPDPLRLDGASMFAAIDGAAQVLHAQLADPAGTLASLRGPGAGPTNGLGLTFEPNADGTFLAIAILAGDAPLDGHLVLYGSAGVQVLGRTTGPAFLFREPDFHGAVNVVAHVPFTGPTGVPRHTVGAKVLEATAAPLTVEGNLFLMFDGISNSRELQMGYDTPGGATELPCLPNGPVCEAMAMLHGEGPGDYALRIGHNVDFFDSAACQPVHCFLPAVWAAGADVMLP